MRRRALRYFAVSVLAAGLCLPQASAFAASPVPAPPAGTVLGHQVHVMPFGATAARSALRNAAAPAGAQLTYYGGRVVSHLRTVGVLYGSGSYRGYVTGGVSPNMGTFLTGTANSPYLGWLDGEYNTVSPSPTAGLGQTNQRIGSATYAGLTAITPSVANSGTTIQDSQSSRSCRRRSWPGTCLLHRRTRRATTTPPTSCTSRLASASAMPLGARW